MKLLVALAMLVVAPLAPLAAATGTYTITGTGSGSLDSTAFTDAAFTFTLTGDTSNLSGNILDPLSSALVDISGLGTVTVGIPTRLGIKDDAAFFSRAGNSLDLFDFFGVSGVNLGTTFGPVTGTDVFAIDLSQNSISTTGGALTFNSSSNVQFAGTVGLSAPAVPEPATWAMMLMGFGAIGTSIRYRRRKADISFV